MINSWRWPVTIPETQNSLSFLCSLWSWLWTWPECKMKFWYKDLKGKRKMWFLRLKLILFPRQHQKKKISGHKSGLTPLSTLLYFYCFCYLYFVKYFVSLICYLSGILFVWLILHYICIALFVFHRICYSLVLIRSLLHIFNNKIYFPKRSN